MYVSGRLCFQQKVLFYADAQSRLYEDCRGVRHSVEAVIERADLASAIEEMLAADGPFLLEACVIEEGNVLPMTPPGGSVNAMLLEC